jgi:hypothetical protein
MTNTTDQNEKFSPGAAIGLIREMEQAALRRAQPAKWLGVVTALLGGIITALAAAETSRLFLAPIFLLMVISVVFQICHSGAIIKLNKPKLIMAIVFVMMISGLLILGARELALVIGIWAPLILGVLVSIAVFSASIFERRFYQTCRKTSSFISTSTASKS